MHETTSELENLVRGKTPSHTGRKKILKDGVIHHGFHQKDMKVSQISGGRHAKSYIQKAVKVKAIYESLSAH